MLGSEYGPVDIADREAYLPYFAALPQKTADYTFTNIWGWSEYFYLEWKESNGLCWIRQNPKNEESRLWAPVGDWNSVDWTTIPDLRPGTVMIRVPEPLCNLLQEQLPDRVIIEETRGQWEYLYTQQALSTLSGKILHKKKNHVNAYRKLYGENYVVLQSEHMPQVLSLQQDWCEWRECEQSVALLAESDVVFSVLRQWDQLPGLIGGALLAEGKMAAFAVGEKLDDRTLVVHFEKGRPEFRGVYQAINYAFAKYAGEGFELIDREQDTDEEGLRQAKESYCPVGFLKKNTVRFV